MWLRDLLLSRMIALSDDERDRLFSSYGPLGSFSAKITLSHALGLFGQRTRHDLDNLKAIRNAFAHTNLDIDFDTPEVAALCEKFNCLKGLEDRDGRGPQELLSIATKALIIHLLQVHQEGSGILKLEGLD